MVGNFGGQGWSRAEFLFSKAGTRVSGNFAISKEWRRVGLKSL